MKKIISVGFDIPGSEDYQPYTSSQSLLDADVIVFQPDFDDYTYHKDYQGKPACDENESFRLTEDTRHWKAEISTALQEGKTVFVFMCQYKEVFIHTGKKEYSGTGRNARVTNMVSSYNNYNFLPVSIPSLIAKEGTELKFNNNSIFTTFWNEFKGYIKYESYMEGKIDAPLFFTKTGNKPVGGLFHVGKGNLVLLPPVRYPEDFATYKDMEVFWTEDAIRLGKRLIQALIDIDNALRDTIETSPPPEWIAEEKYVLKSELELKSKIDAVSHEIEILVSEKNTLVDALQHDVRLKNLLFEKGKPLETAIIYALEILQYKAENYDDGFLEIDQVIIAPEGERYIGEAEGKDTSAINIDKFRQLESNIQEDLQREEITEPAIGILFGNGFRLIPPQEREEQYTEKCIKNAERLNAVLIRTSDLFNIAKYIKENKDDSLAKECRKAILESRGKIVTFPAIPRKLFASP